MTGGSGDTSAADRAAPVPGRMLLAALLVAEALLVLSPLLAVSSWWIGAQLLGKYVTQVRTPDVLVLVGAELGGPLLVLLLVVAAAGAWQGQRRVLTLLLQPAVVAVSLVPFLQPLATLGRLPAWRLLPAALALVAVVLLLVTWRAPRPARRWSGVLTTAVLVLLALTVVGGVLGSRSTRLPDDPLLFLARPESSGATGAAVDVLPPPQNPALAADPYNSIHNDAWATDTYLGPGPRDPMGADTDSVFTGGDCATLTFDRRGRLLTLCSSLTRVTAWAVDPATMAPLASTAVSTRPPSLTDFSGGGYFVLDSDDRMVTPTRGGVIRALELRDAAEGAAFVETQAWDVSTSLLPDEPVTSVIPDWSGRMWFVGARGTVGLVTPVDGAVRAVNLGAESIENSFAVAQDAVYVVTGAALYRLWTDAGGAPVVVWREPYDAGSQRKPGQTARASGTTPTVFDGGALVAFTDNAEPRMNVVVARTDISPAGPRTICREPVFAEGASATENSLVAVGRALLVENNFGYQPPFTSTAAGSSVQPGVSRIDADRVAGTCRTAWTNESLHVPSAVSKASAADGLLYTYTKPPSALGPDAWFATAVDLADGSVAWSRPLGGGLPFNNHYASVAIGPDGSYFVGTTMGIAVLRSSP